MSEKECENCHKMFEVKPAYYGRTLYCRPCARIVHNAKSRESHKRNYVKVTRRKRVDFADYEIIFDPGPEPWDVGATFDFTNLKAMAANEAINIGVELRNTKTGDRLRVVKVPRKSTDPRFHDRKIVKVTE